MTSNIQLTWILNNSRRRNVLLAFSQPMTSSQITDRLNLPLDSSRYVLWELLIRDFVRCLNPEATRSRLYWLSDSGIQLQSKLCNELQINPLQYNFPKVDWNLYGWVCFSHRAASILALDRPRQPSEIKRRARYQNPEIKMSANNVRDVVKLFLAKGIVRKVMVRKQYHPCYELTALGEKLRSLLGNLKPTLALSCRPDGEII